jgi:hypothetical protein
MSRKTRDGIIGYDITVAGIFILSERNVGKL